MRRWWWICQGEVGEAGSGGELGADDETVVVDMPWLGGCGRDWAPTMRQWWRCICQGEVGGVDSAGMIGFQGWVTIY